MASTIYDQDVRGTPAFRLYKQGRCVRSFSGLLDGELRAEMEKTLNMNYKI